MTATGARIMPGSATSLSLTRSLRTCPSTCRWMSCPALERFGNPYIVTVGADGRPRATSVRSSGKAAADARGGPPHDRERPGQRAVALLWPAPAPGEHALIVDGWAAVLGGPETSRGRLHPRHGRWPGAAVTGRIKTERPDARRSATTTGSRELQDRFDTRRLADRLDERIVRDHPARGRGVHRADGHVLPRDRRCRGPSAVLVQGRRAGLRARARPAARSRSRATTATACSCRWATCSQPARRAAVHRLLAERPRGCASRASRRCERDDPLAGAGRGRSSSSACGRHACSRTARATSTAWRS